MGRPAWRRLAPLLLPALLLAAPARPAQAELFGRWQQQPRRCELEQRGARPLRCHALQIDQRNAEVVRLILQADGQERGELLQFSLVGGLVEGSQPMACRNGSCSLRQPLQLQLISVSVARFDGRGLALALPNTWPVQGRCSVDPAALHCEASAEFANRLDDGGRSPSLAERIATAAPQWSVDAELR